MNARLAAAAAAMAVVTAGGALGYLQNPVDGLEHIVHRWGYSPPEIARELAVAWAFALAGLIAMHRRPGSRAGVLMVGVGAALVLEGFQYLPIPVFVTLGMWLGTAPGLAGVLLGVLVLTYPSGRVESNSARAWIITGIGYLVVQLVAALLTPIPVASNCVCPPLIVLRYDEPLLVEFVSLGDLVFAAMALVLVVGLVHRWLRTTAPARRAVAPVWFAGAVIIVVAITSQSYWSLQRLGGYFRTTIPNLGELIWGDRDPGVWLVLPWIQSVTLLLVPLALLWGLLRIRLRQSAVGALAIDLAGVDGQRSLVGALRKAVGDWSLELAFWSRPAGSYVNDAGEPVELPEPGSQRSTTLLADDDGGPLAALIHDPALDDQPALVKGAAAVARLSIQNERLHAEVRAQLEEVRASRERIVRAADDERRRVERNLHDGAQQRLVSLSVALAMAQSQMKSASPDVGATLAEAEAELKQAIGELRELARGIHPAILEEAGLAPALESLAERSPVPVRLECAIDDRLPALVEATAYFVAAEALTNVAKYASARSVILSATHADGWLHLAVADDGVGGADASRGSGLRGLFDRVAAVGGRLSVEARREGGTLVAAEIPCG